MSALAYAFPVTGSGCLVPSDSLETFVSQHRPQLLRTAVLLTGDVHAGEDLLQDALIRISQNWPRITTSPEAYARKVLATMSVDRWRRLFRRPESLHASPWEVSGEQADHPGNSDERLIMLAAIRRLPARQRAVITLRFYADMSEQETAAALGISQSSVKQHARRAAAALRGHLAADFPHLASDTTAATDDV